MTRLQTTDFDNEMKILSMSVYKGKENFIPKDWIKISEFDNTKSGFHGEAFFKNGKIIISMRGTEINDKNDLANDIDLLKKKLPNQYADAQKFYEKVKKDFPNQEIAFTGHSLGGSLAQLMGNKTGHETVTFNAYGIADILQENKNNNSKIRNYGHIDDTVFNLNLNNQLGDTYILGSESKDGYITKSQEGDYLGGTYPLKYHSIETMGNLEDAVEYKPYRLEGQVNMDIDYKDIDTNRIFTNEEIGQMSSEEYSRLENFIDQQVAAGKVMPETQAQSEVRAGNLIWVEPYTRADGTEVRGYYRSR